MSEDSLGRLKAVELRDVWASEASNFTPWLAQPDSLKLLGKTLGIELELEAQEKEVGPFRADILCKNVGDDSWVLIENQLERTDHTHLGQLLTYAAGLKAVTIVWIARRFTEEHRAALDWLNEITDDSFNFFGLEVELWQIGESSVAPKFNMVSKPNDWSRTVHQAARQIQSEGLTETRQLQLRYWTELADFLIKEGSHVKPQTPKAQMWMVYAVGRSNFALWTRFNTWDGYIGVGLSCQGAEGKAHLALLRREQSTIEKEIGEELRWWAAGIEGLVQIRRKIDPANEADWPKQREWLKTKLELFDRVFRQRVRVLDAKEIDSTELDELEQMNEKTEAMGEPASNLD
ncbi:MAG: DUF4268 domain-containing protein [Planctomycetota bacterium]|jgi:hypothetical protein